MNETIHQILQQAGGYKAVADALSKRTGKEFSYGQVKKWPRRGIPARWVPALSEITGVPMGLLHADFRVKRTA